MKNFHEDELKTLFNMIRKREFDGNEFDALKDSYSIRHKVEVRIAVIKLLTKIPSKKVLKYLKKKRRWAISSDEKKTLDVLIKHLKETL